MLVAAIVIAVVAFWLTRTYLSSKEDSLRMQLLEEQGEYVSVVVATQPLAPGDIISLDNMAIAKVPATNVSGSAVTPENFHAYEQQVIRQFMTPGEPLLGHFVAGLGIDRFSDLLDKGERAVTLEIDDINSVAGMILPGDFVDIMLVIDEIDLVSAAAGSQDNKNLKPLLQNVRILSVDALSLVSKEQDFIAQNTMTNDSAEYSSVTVGVDFEEATKLVLARDIGDLVFMLRNQEDKGLLKADLLTREDLLNKSGGTSNSYKYYGGSQASGGTINAQLRTVSKAAGAQSQKYIKSLPIYKADKTKESKQVSIR
nr:Flp pilus assembly protein CpaB [Pleionea sp. CnH1-48]